MMDNQHMMEKEAAARGILKENYEEWYEWPSNGSFPHPDGYDMFLSPDSNLCGSHSIGFLVMPLEQHAIFTGYQWNINPAYQHPASRSFDASYSPPEELGSYVTSDFNMSQGVTGFDAPIHHFAHSIDNQSLVWPPCESEMSMIAINNLKLNPYASEFIPRSGYSSPVASSTGSNYTWEQSHNSSDLQNTSITPGHTGSVIPDVTIVEPEDNTQQWLHESLPATSQNNVQVACLSQPEYPIYRPQPTEPQHVQVFGTMPTTDCVRAHPVDYRVPSCDLRNHQPEHRFPIDEQSHRGDILSRASATLPSTYTAQRASNLSLPPSCVEFINQVPYNLSLLNKYFFGNEYQASQRSETADSDLHFKPGHTANETTAAMEGINKRKELSSKIINELKKLPVDNTESTPKREAVALVILRCIAQYVDQNTADTERQRRVIDHLASRFDMAVLSTERWQDKCLRATTEHEEKKTMYQLKIADLQKQIAAEKEQSIYCQMLAQAPQGQAMYGQGVDTSSRTSYVWPGSGHFCI